MAKLDLLAIAVVARDMIDKGWMQGNWYRKEGENEFVCAEGAIQQAVRGQIKNEIRMSPICSELNKLTDAQSKIVVEKMALALSREREQMVFNYLCKTLGVVSIPGWNDDKRRQKHEVLDLFDKLIKQLQGLEPADRFVDTKLEQSIESSVAEYAKVVK